MKMTIDGVRKVIKAYGDDAATVCAISDAIQALDLRVCPRNIYKDAAVGVCNGRRGCPKKFSTCWHKFFKEGGGK